MSLSNMIIKKINDMRIKYIKLLKHKGACYSRNVGIKKAKGRYISFLDSDDVFLPKKLKTQINNLIKHNSDFDFCKVNRIYSQTILVKKTYIEKYLFDEEIPRLQDYELLIRMLPSIKVSFTNEILVNSFLQNDSITKNRSKIINTAKLLLKKKYSLNTEQKKNFSRYLNRILTIEKII